MLRDVDKVHFDIETLNLERKVVLPSIKDLSSVKVVNIYENFRQILPNVNFSKIETRVSENLEDILNNFEVLFLDAFGVINLGNELVPGIKKTIEIARDRGIILIILTNGATFNSSKKINQFFELGLEFSFDEIISSRDVAERFLNLNNPQGSLGLLGDQDDFKIPNLLSVQLEENLDKFDEVNSFLFLGTSKWDSMVQEILQDTLLRKPRPIFVANPDLVAPHVSKFSIEPGFYTFHLINNGVNLPIWFGKPFPLIFQMALDKVKSITGKNINLSKIGMVGDTLHTDILGANCFGIKSILMTNHGLLKNNKISTLIKKTGIIPDFIVQNP